MIDSQHSINFTVTQIWIPEVQVDNFVGKTNNWGLSGGSSAVTMQGCEGKGRIKVSYQLEVSCPLDFKNYPFDRQVKLPIYELTLPYKKFL